MSWTTADIPNLSGKVAVVTGANGGLGLETARALAGAGAHVVMAARSPAKTAEAVEDILASHPAASLETVALDLASLASVRSCADAILAKHPAIDILVNNAGLMALPEGRTADGFETQLGVNHLGHWALTAHLMPAILNAPAARVVTVSSMARYQGRAIDPDNTTLDGAYDPWKAYGRSKLANYHFGIGLQREFERHGARAASLIAHPGLSHTNLQVHTDEQGGAGTSGRRWRTIAERQGMSAARGALSQLRAATDPQAKGGQFYGPRFVSRGIPVRLPLLRRVGLTDAIASLWAVSERETGIALNLDGAHASR